MPLRRELLGIINGERAQETLLGRAEIQSRSGDIGGDEKEIDADLLRQFRAGQVLVDDSIHSGKASSFPDDGNAAAATAYDDEVHLEEDLDFTLFDDGNRLRGGDYPTVPFGGFPRGKREGSGLVARVWRADRFGGIREGG
jgi:hypothetical protein